jgi:hypothetical protein
VDPDDVKTIRARLNVLDPAQILGEYSAAATGDMATLIACNHAHPSAYPNIHKATSCAAMTGRQNQPVKPPVKVSEKQWQQ